MVDKREEDVGTHGNCVGSLAVFPSGLCFGRSGSFVRLFKKAVVQVTPWVGLLILMSLVSARNECP